MFLCGGDQGIMKKEEIIVWLRDFLLCENVSAPEGSDWVAASCPLAKWFHTNGKDAKPSFGVKVPTKEGDLPGYDCKACGSKGSLPALMHALTQLSGEWNKAASSFLSLHLAGDEVLGKFKNKSRISTGDRFLHLLNREVKSVATVPASVLEKYPLLADRTRRESALVLDWLLEARRITMQSIVRNYLRLYLDPIGGLGVIFPIISRDGIRVLDMWVRLIQQKRFFRLNAKITGSSVDYHAPHLCFGNHTVDLTQPVFLVEGPMDLLRLNTLGVKNVLATLGEFSADQIESFYARWVYVAFDADDSGREKAIRAIRKLKRLIPFVYRIDWETVGIKDPGQLDSVEQVREALSRAEVFTNLQDQRHLTSRRKYAKLKSNLSRRRPF